MTPGCNLTDGLVNRAGGGFDAKQGAEPETGAEPHETLRGRGVLRERGCVPIQLVDAAAPLTRPRAGPQSLARTWCARDPSRAWWTRPAARIAWCVAPRPALRPPVLVRSFAATTMSPTCPRATCAKLPVFWAAPSAYATRAAAQVRYKVGPQPHALPDRMGPYQVFTLQVPPRSHRRRSLRRRRRTSCEPLAAGPRARGHFIYCHRNRV